MKATEILLIIATAMDILMIAMLSVFAVFSGVEVLNKTPGAGWFFAISLIGLAIAGVGLYLLSDSLAEI